MISRTPILTLCALLLTVCNADRLTVGTDGSTSSGASCGGGVCYELFKRNTSRSHPNIIPLTHTTTACAAKFVSMSSRPLDMYWDDGRHGVEQGALQAGATTTTNSYETHTFYFTEVGNKEAEVARVTIVPGQTVYPIFDESHPGDAQAIALVKEEEQFSEEYFRKTGIKWRHYYGPTGPRPPPVLPMWPAVEVGNIHGVTSPNGYWLVQNLHHISSSLMLFSCL